MEAASPEGFACLGRMNIRLKWTFGETEETGRYLIIFSIHASDIALGIVEMRTSQFGVGGRHLKNTVP